METNIHTEEHQIEEMRQQIALLKAKLENETIITDKMIRSTIKQKMEKINGNTIFSYIACLFVITFGSAVLYDISHSYLFIIVTIVYMLTCAIATFLIHRNVRKDDVNGDLFTVAQKMKKVKKQYHDWIYFALPTVILWFGWLCWLIYQRNPESTDYYMIIGLVVGGVAGGFIGRKMNKRVINTCDEIINQIEE